MHAHANNLSTLWFSCSYFKIIKTSPECEPNKKVILQTDINSISVNGGKRNRVLNEFPLATLWKWKCIENDNSGNIAPPCHQCLHILCLAAVSKHFFILFPHPQSLVCETLPSRGTQEHSHSTSQPAESTWKQFSFNQVHYKGPSDANLSNTTILRPPVFSQLHLSLSTLYWFLHERLEIVFTDIMRILVEFIALSGQIQM